MNENFKIETISHEINNYVNTSQYVRNMDNFMQLASSIRLLLHDHLYSDIENVNLLIKYLNVIDLFNIEYNETDKTIHLKIKKTNMKKYPNYSHNVSFYYGLFNQILITFFYDKYDDLCKIFNTYSCQYGISPSIEYLLDNRIISMIYTITSILDNIVIIHL